MKIIKINMIINKIMKILEIYVIIMKIMKIMEFHAKIMKIMKSLNYNIDLIVGHKLSFDINMLKVELMREINNKNNLSNKRIFSELFENLNDMKPESHELYCTMQKSIELCNLKMVNKFGKEYLTQR